MNLLRIIAEREERESSLRKKFNPYFELNRVGIPIEKRKEIVKDAYGFLRRIILKPLILKVTLEEINAEKIYGKEALERIENSLKIPYKQ